MTEKQHKVPEKVISERIQSRDEATAAPLYPEGRRTGWVHMSISEGEELRWFHQMISIVFSFSVFSDDFFLLFFFSVPTVVLLRHGDRTHGQKELPIG